MIFSGGNGEQCDHSPLHPGDTYKTDEDLQCQGRVPGPPVGV